MKGIKDRKRLRRYSDRRARRVIARRWRARKRVAKDGRSLALQRERTARAKSGAETAAPLPQEIGGSTRITAPKVLSMTRNPEACVRFLAELDGNLRARKKTTVNLNDVESIEYDGI